MRVSTHMIHISDGSPVLYFDLEIPDIEFSFSGSAEELIDMLSLMAKLKNELLKVKD